MKRQALGEIKQLEIAQILAKVTVSRMELSDLVLDKSMKKLKDIKVISKKRADVAQMLTIARQKQLLEQIKSVQKNSANQVSGEAGKSEKSEMRSNSKASGKSKTRVSKKGAK